MFVLSKLLDQKGHFINLLQKHPPSKGRSAKIKNCFPFLFPIKCVCTVDMVNTVDTAELFGTLIIKSLCLGWMDGTDGDWSNPLDLMTA